MQRRDGRDIKITDIDCPVQSDVDNPRLITRDKHSSVLFP